MVTLEIEKFDPVNVSSKFAICGIPIRVDTYKTCTFGCRYCFSNCRVIMSGKKEFQVGNIPLLENRLKRIASGDYSRDSFLDVLISEGYTWHCGGMSDPFQPCEKDYHITKQLVELSNKYNIHILFSTKSDTLYGCDINPKLHTFQFSVTNVEDRKDLEPNVPSIKDRLKLYRELKDMGFKVGIRIQPFIPGVSTLDIVKTFPDADNFTIEGIKLVPQNHEHIKFMLGVLKENTLDDFFLMGLLNLKPDLRFMYYREFIDYFEEHNIPYSIADNDLHYKGNNFCCCGDRLVNKSTSFNNTAMSHKYGIAYSKSQLDSEIKNSCVGDCKCNYLFASSRQEGCVTVNDFYNKRFHRRTSPFSPSFLYTSMWDLLF